jgi:hypothetical protein
MTSLVLTVELSDPAIAEAAHKADLLASATFTAPPLNQAEIAAEVEAGIHAARAEKRARQMRNIVGNRSPRD